MGINDVFKKVFNVEIDVTDDDLYEEDENELKRESVEEIRPRERAGYKMSSNMLATTTNSSGEAQSTVIVFEPKRFNDAPTICDKLKEGITVVVNMDEVDLSDAKKIFDFLSGAVYVLNASMKKVAEHVFVLAPIGTDIQTSDMDELGEVDIWEFEG